MIFEITGIVVIITSLVENYFILKSLGLFFDERKRIIRYLFVFTLSLISILANTFDESYIILIPILLLIIYSLLNFHENRCKVIFASLMIFLANLTISLLEVLAIEVFFNTFILDHKDSLVYFAIVISSKILLYILCILIKNYFIKRKINHKEVQYLKTSIVFTLIILAIVITLIGFYSINLFATSVLFFVAILLLLGSFLFFVGIYELNKLKQKNSILSVELDRLEYAKDSLNELKKINNVNSKNSHDFKNHLIHIQYSLNKEKVDEAKEYVNKLLENSTITQKINCGNEMLNYILNYKNMTMMKNNIQFCTNISDLLERIDTCSLTTILGNLLDNAIEAQENLSDKKIDLIIKRVKVGVLLQLSNSVAKTVDIINGEISTTKSKDENEHGIGLQSVRDALLSNNGIYEITCDDNIFCFKILFLDK